MDDHLGDDPTPQEEASVEKHRLNALRLTQNIIIRSSHWCGTTRGLYNPDPNLNPPNSPRVASPHPRTQTGHTWSKALAPFYYHVWP